MNGAARPSEHCSHIGATAGLPPIEKPPTNRSFWFVLLLIVAVSLSGPLWLPYTGVKRPPTARIKKINEIGFLYLSLVFCLTNTWQIYCHLMRFGA